MPDFTIEEVFGKKLKGSCPLGVPAGAREPQSLCIDLSSNQKAVAIAASPLEEKRKDHLLCYTMPGIASQDLMRDSTDTRSQPNKTLTSRSQQATNHSSSSRAFLSSSPTAPSAAAAKNTAA